LSGRLAVWAVRLTALGLVAAGGIYAWSVTQERAGLSGISDVIVAPDPDLNNMPWLKPNLEDALVVVPDRPHGLDEVQAQRTGAATTIHRTRTYRLRTNSLGLRGPEVDKKTTGTSRIIAIGDSVTHGWGVSEEESYPAQLEAMLEERGKSVEVLNAGVPANNVPVMRDWCRSVGPSLAPDVIVWTRRPPHYGPAPAEDFVRSMKACAQATRAELVVVLPPISTFDLRGQRSWQDEERALKKLLRAEGVPVVELTPHFQAAQEGRGVVLVLEPGKVKVVDQEAGTVLLEEAFNNQDIPRSVYALFEADDDVREALFFDQGHPDEEGFELFARVVADAVEPLLP